MTLTIRSLLHRIKSRSLQYRREVKVFSSVLLLIHTKSDKGRGSSDGLLSCWHRSVDNYVLKLAILVLLFPAGQLEMVARFVHHCQYTMVANVNH